MPNVLSWDIGYPFPSNFAWTGTRDPSNWLAVPAAFDFMDRFGESAVRQHNHKLIREGVDLLQVGGLPAQGRAPVDDLRLEGLVRLVPLCHGRAFSVSS